MIDRDRRRISGSCALTEMHDDAAGEITVVVAFRWCYNNTGRISAVVVFLLWFGTVAPWGK